MRATQFFALNKQITTLMREEEAQALTIHHSSKPDVRLREIVSELNAIRKIRNGRESAAGLIARGEATSIASAELEAERERQKANWEAIKRDPAAWMQKMREKAVQMHNAPSNAPSTPE